MGKAPSVQTVKQSQQPQIEKEVKKSEIEAEAKQQHQVPQHEYQGDHKKSLFKDDWSSEAKAAIGEVERYAEMMCPRYSRSTKDIIQYQTLLAGMLDKVCAFEEASSFMSAMNGIFDVVEAHRGDSFKETMLFRGWSQLPFSSRKLMHAENMFNMLLVFCNKAEAKNAQYRFDVLYDGFDVPAHADRLVAYLKRRSGQA